MERPAEAGAWASSIGNDPELREMIVGSIHEGVLVTDAEERIVAVNDAVCRMTGYDRAELVGKTCALLQGPETQPELIEGMRAAIEAEETFIGEVLNYRKDGTPYWNGLSIAPVRRGGVATHFVSVQRDITDFVADRTLAESGQETAAMMLRVSRELSGAATGSQVAQIVADAVPVLWGSDRSTVLFWDDESARFVMAGLSGWGGAAAEMVRDWESTRAESPDLAELMDSGMPALLHRSSSEWARELMETFEFEALGLTPVQIGGRFLGIIGGHWASTPPPTSLNDTLRERMMAIAGLAGVALGHSRLREAIDWSMGHDALTGLPNRRMLEEHITEQLAELAEHGGDDVVVLACDVNRFTAIRETYPTAVVDSVLREIAARLVSTIGDEGFVARLGGDDFVIVIRARPEDAEATGSRLLDAFLAPFAVGDDTVHAGLAVGGAVSADVAQSPTEAFEAFGPTVAQRLISLARADLTARRLAYRAGQKPEDPQDAGLDSELRSAVRNGEIEVYYQPQVRLHDGALVGVEALVRWNHPRLGQVSPLRFIPLAEYNGSIREIGRFVFETACADAARWAASGHPLEMSVNVAVHQLEDPTFSDRVVRTVSTHGLPNERLTLEVTETRLVSDRSVPQAQLHRLRELGFVISIDDFGTGFSSLTQLSNLPVGELKIDRSFVSGATGAGRSIVAGVVGFARGLGLRVVAEGVEDAEQYEVLRKLGCDRAQGYHLARPMPAEQLEREWLS
ncbi:MAG: EAL domain-containing protein [Salinibacterium sp.]|nr:EAL domain-containing protein [Salinibacterium sp.]MBF0672751.1 EAL domain-containing protein [Salinibacterium sp.]